MGSGVLPLAMATRPATPAGLWEAGEGGRAGSVLCERGVFWEVCGAGWRRVVMILAAGRGAPGDRAISTARLRGLPRFHLRPIDVVVYHGSRRDLVLRRVSRLDAFSGYPGRT